MEGVAADALRLPEGSPCADGAGGAWGGDAATDLGRGHRRPLKEITNDAAGAKVSVLTLGSHGSPGWGSPQRIPPNTSSPEA